MQRRRIGASRLQRLTCSMRSRSVGSAQWTSSRTTTTGRRRESVSNSRRTAQKSSSGDPCRARQRAEALDDERAVGLLPNGVRDRVLAAERAQELGEGPEGDPVAVREAAPREDGRVVANLRRELGRKPRLTDAGGAEDGDEPALPPVRACR